MSLFKKLFKPKEKDCCQLEIEEVKDDCCSTVDQNKKDEDCCA